MANILLDILPTSVTVNGVNYSVDTDYRTFIVFEKVIQDDDLSAREKVESVMNLLFLDEKPSDLNGAMNVILDLYRCGKPPEAIKQPRKNGDVELKQQAIYDYCLDAPLIFAAFLSQYGIDLNEIEYLHWWKFQAMFTGLRSDNKIVEIMGYRAADPSKIKDKKERERITRLKRAYALPRNLTFEEKVAMAGAAFGGVAF